MFRETAVSSGGQRKGSAPVGYRRVCRVDFFLQAEDGIRYLTVTGVQTCALPISALFPYWPNSWRGCSISAIRLPCHTGATLGVSRLVLVPSLTDLTLFLPILLSCSNSS